jgi:protoporphyrinogen oxidase
MTAEERAAKRCVVIGGGPAGLTAAYELTKFGVRPVVVEKERIVGGLARTESYRGFRFDMGGHRFFSKIEEVNKFWREALGSDFTRRPRLSRIYYEGKFFAYPLRPLNALLGLGPWQSLLVVLSYVRWQLFPYRREETFEQWVTNRFGRRLFRTFFKTYTEKVWGIPCTELRAEWAAQRIKDLSLRTALLSMFVKPRGAIKTLIEEFEYPRLGPGMMWSAVQDEVERRGGRVRVGADVVRIRRTGSRVEHVVVRQDGRDEVLEGSDFISSMPLTELAGKLDPPPPAGVLRAAEQLSYRDFLTVCLIVDKPDLFPDNWIYIHSPEVRVGRIQNFKNWSRDMVPDPRKSSLGLEYFCSEGDALWTAPDAELVEMGKREIERIGLARAGDVEDGCVVRVAKAYPVYDATYREHLETLKGFVEGLENLQTIGRNGLHRYNNQDHAMLTGMLAVRNLMLGEANDLWSVNTEPEYHEEARVALDEGRAAEAVRRALPLAFPRLDRLALGISSGLTAGLALLVATLVLVANGGGAEPGLALLGQYFPGYTVTATGSLVGFAYAFVTGFTAGWLFALLRNTAVLVYLAAVRQGAERSHLRRLLDYL